MGQFKPCNMKETQHVDAYYFCLVTHDCTRMQMLQRDAVSKYGTLYICTCFHQQYTIFAQ